MVFYRSGSSAMTATRLAKSSITFWGTSAVPAIHTTPARLQPQKIMNDCTKRKTINNYYSHRGLFLCDGYSLLPTNVLQKPF